MLDPTWLALVADPLALLCVLFLNFPICKKVAQQGLIAVSWKSRPKVKWYEDEDGEATTGSINESSGTIQVMGNMIWTIIGVGLAIVHVTFVSAELETRNNRDRQLRLAMWALHLLQSRVLQAETLYTARFTFGVLGGASRLMTAFALSTDCYQRDVSDHYPKAPLLVIQFQIVAAIAGVCCNWAIPRRPDVFRQGQLVEREASTSLLSLITFTWAEPLLNITHRSKLLEFRDLPIFRSEYSTRGLREDVFTKTRREDSAARDESFVSALWQLSRKTLLRQALMGIVIIGLSYAPQGALFGLLRSLDLRQSTSQQESRPWAYVLMLCLPMMASAALEHVRYWIAYRSLMVRTQQHLMVALFDKSLCISDACTTDPGVGKNLVNLMAVDVKRLADFLLNSSSIYGVPLRLFISAAILVKLVGWQSLLASVAVLLLLYPLNRYTVKGYSGAQRKMMGYRDQKMAALTEALHGIRQIKFSAWEVPWEEKINDLRDGELEAQWAVFRWDLILMSLYLLTPTVLSTVVLTVYSLTHGGLSPATAFTAISILGTMQTALTAMPGIISSAVDGVVSGKRVQQYLSMPERQPHVVSSERVEFDDATVAWSGHGGGEGGILKNVNMRVPMHGLTLITGPTGAGKSLLLAAMLGECDILSGTVKAPTRRAWNAESSEDNQWLVDSAVAYVSQSLWVEATTVKENVLFGLPYNMQRYNQVMTACALEQDLQGFPDGDDTHLGPNGVNLSGGQKWRLSLARALYSRATVLLLDDIFSAVDVHTASHLYQHALTGPLSHARTRILVTHHISLCTTDADYIVHVDGCTVHYHGPVFSTTPGSIPSSTSFCKTRRVPFSSNTEVTDTSDAKGTLIGGSKSGLTRTFIEEEGREQGTVKWGVFRDYAQQSGTWGYWLLLVAAFLTYSALMLSRTWWLSVWSASDQGQVAQESALGYYINVYILLSVLVCMVGSGRSYFALSGSVKASRSLFRRLLHRVLRAPLQWIDTVPVGRVLNRFSSDFNLVDSLLGDDVRAMLSHGMDILMAVASSLLVNPLLVFGMLILGVITVKYASRYLIASLEVRRLDSVARSPIYDHVGSCMAGLWTIRAFGRTDIYREQFREKLDRKARAQWHGWLLNQWLAFRMDIIGVVFTAASTTCVVALGVNAALAGFAISFTMRLTQTISMGVRRYASLELDLNSVERILEYSHLDTEHDAGYAAPAHWPLDGALEVKNLTVRYAADMNPVLHGVSFQVARGQRVGIIGRTGAGKSSLALALLRVLEASEGSIFIDGIDISTIRLADLRSRLVIIPQHPTIFGGTLRFNLDPLCEYRDAELLSALALVHWDTSAHGCGEEQLKKDEENLQTADDVLSQHRQEGGASVLDSPVADGGSNLSHGQRQLLCLARTFVRKPRVLIMDEATSAVDKDTDTLIQHVLGLESSRNAMTLLVIAHRLSTVANFDRILVLGEGRVVEFGRPVDLMHRDNGVFRAMVEKDAGREALTRAIFNSGDKM